MTKKSIVLSDVNGNSPLKAVLTLERKDDDIAGMIRFYNLPFELWNIRVAEFLVYFATIMSIISMIEYFNLNKKLILGPKEEN